MTINHTKNTKSKLGNASLLTLIAIYFLILVGGIVRSTGSGMGCPDWPQCFGSWVPPTTVEQLPADYKEVYSQKRQKKNIKLARYLDALGFEEKAEQIRTDQSILEEADFNAAKTWTEYVNRLVGVIIGIFTIATCYFSLRHLKSEPSLFYLSLASLLLVIFQGWIGSLVVSTNLLPFMVTVHMVLALFIVALLCVLVIRANPQLYQGVANIGRVKVVLVIAMIMMLIQIVFGTQVREEIDMLTAQFVPRGGWVDQLGVPFLVHRSFSWVVMITSGYVLFLLMKYRAFNMTAQMLTVVVILSVITGTVLAYFGVPALVQPLHLLLGSLGFGLQFFLFLQLKSDKVIAT